MTQPITFADLALDASLRPGLDALDYTRLTPIQAQALPAVLDGRDLIAQAPTGSGKTAAFGLGLLQGIDAGALHTQALVLCPTRELADQVGKQLRKLATGIANLKLSVLCGGIPLGPQLASLTHAPHVVVGTPGRVLELVQKDALDLRKVRTLVLDEADRLLDIDDIGAVVNYELPTDADTYLHRIGRTGRAGRNGLALSLVAPQERERAAKIEERQGTAIRYERIAPLDGRPSGVPEAAMVTLRIDAGRTDKLRPGDIVGALTGEAGGLQKDEIGKIDVFATRSYVAIARAQAKHALAQLRAGKIKGRKFRVNML